MENNKSREIIKFIYLIYIYNNINMNNFTEEDIKIISQYFSRILPYLDINNKIIDNNLKYDNIITNQFVYEFKLDNKLYYIKIDKSSNFNLDKYIKIINILKLSDSISYFNIRLYHISNIIYNFIDNIVYLFNYDENNNVNIYKLLYTYKSNNDDTNTKNYYLDLIKNNKNIYFNIYNKHYGTLDNIFNNYNNNNNLIKNSYDNIFNFLDTILNIYFNMKNNEYIYINNITSENIFFNIINDKIELIYNDDFDIYNEINISPIIKIFKLIFQLITNNNLDNLSTNDYNNIIIDKFNNIDYINKINKFYELYQLYNKNEIINTKILYNIFNDKIIIENNNLNMIKRDVIDSTIENEYYDDLNNTLNNTLNNKLDNNKLDLIKEDDIDSTIENEYYYDLNNKLNNKSNNNKILDNIELNYDNIKNEFNNPSLESLSKMIVNILKINNDNYNTKIIEYENIHEINKEIDKNMILLYGSIISMSFFNINSEINYIINKLFGKKGHTEMIYDIIKEDDKYYIKTLAFGNGIMIMKYFVNKDKIKINIDKKMFKDFNIWINYKDQNEIYNNNFKVLCHIYNGKNGPNKFLFSIICKIICELLIIPEIRKNFYYKSNYSLGDGIDNTMKTLYNVGFITNTCYINIREDNSIKQMNNFINLIYNSVHNYEIDNKMNLICSTFNAHIYNLALHICYYIETTYGNKIYNKKYYIKPDFCAPANLVSSLNSSSNIHKLMIKNIDYDIKYYI